MQSSVTMLYPSKHGNGATKTFLNRLPKNTALGGEGLKFYSRSSFEASSVSTMSQNLLSLLFHVLVDRETEAAWARCPWAGHAITIMHSNAHTQGRRAAKPGWKQIQSLAKWADSQGDPGRSHLELPSLTLCLNSLMLRSGGGTKKGDALIVLVWCSVICFIWGFALFELSSFLSLPGDLCGAFRWNLMKIQVLLEFLERKERVRQATQFTDVQMRKQLVRWGLKNTFVLFPCLPPLHQNPPYRKNYPGLPYFSKSYSNNDIQGRSQTCVCSVIPTAQGTWGLAVCTGVWPSPGQKLLLWVRLREQFLRRRQAWRGAMVCTCFKHLHLPARSSWIVGLPFPFLSTIQLWNRKSGNALKWLVIILSAVFLLRLHWILSSVHIPRAASGTVLFQKQLQGTWWRVVCACGDGFGWQGYSHVRGKV